MNIRELMLEEEHYLGWGSREVRGFWYWLEDLSIVPEGQDNREAIPKFARERPDLEELYARYLIEKEN